ncbi:MAG TPA: hypothetical protein VLY23_07830 [Candidatus Acidoferrum sp.]|nr:hypothetical protein [Candidatus Acidoferrum sp.]
MVMTLERELRIEDLRNHPVERVQILRNLLSRGARVTPDPKRVGFYELEDAGTVYYIHVSPSTGKILLLATWPSEAARSTADEAA